MKNKKNKTFNIINFFICVSFMLFYPFLFIFAGGSQPLPRRAVCINMHAEPKIPGDDYLELGNPDHCHANYVVESRSSSGGSVQITQSNGSKKSCNSRGCGLILAAILALVGVPPSVSLAIGAAVEDKIKRSTTTSGGGGGGTTTTTTTQDQRDNNYYSGSGCFRRRSKIKMADGTYKNIEDIKPGDKVLGKDNKIFVVKSLITHDGVDRPVNDFSNYPLVIITFENGQIFEKVYDHAVYVKLNGEMKLKRFVEEGDILVGENKEDLKVVKIENIYDIKEVVYELELGGEGNYTDIEYSYYVDGVLVDECLLTNKERSKIWIEYQKNITI